MKTSLLTAGILAGLALAPTAFARGKTCVEVSTIVGRQKCTHYGATWAIEDITPVSLGVGARYFAFAPGDHTFGGNLKHDGKVTKVEYNGSALGESPLRSGGTGLRATGFLFPGLYLGMEYGFTLGHDQPRSFSSGGAMFHSVDTPVTTFSMSWGGLVGTRLPLGRVSLRGEVFLGTYALSLSQSITKDGLTHGSESMSTITWAVEPRVAVDLWATPWMTLSGSYGRNLVDGGSQTASLWLLWHTRSFDGAFSL